jgi:hypothetical protein
MENNIFTDRDGINLSELAYQNHVNFRFMILDFRYKNQRMVV